MCGRVQFPKYVSLVARPGKQLLEKQILEIILDILDILDILINIMQHEQYYLIILLIGLKAETLLKKRLTQTFSCEF